MPQGISANSKNGVSGFDHRRFFIGHLMGMAARNISNQRALVGGSPIRYPAGVTGCEYPCEQRNACCLRYKSRAGFRISRAPDQLAIYPVRKCNSWSIAAGPEYWPYAERLGVLSILIDRERDRCITNLGGGMICIQE